MRISDWSSDVCFSDLPPDLSLMTKARHHGSAYVYSLLTGFQAQPAELLKEFPDAKTPEGLHYNPYFPNLNLAMAPPLTADGQVTYGDGRSAERRGGKECVSTGRFGWSAYR